MPRACRTPCPPSTRRRSAHERPDSSPHRPERPNDRTGPRPPREPFSDASQERGLLTLKIREPLLMGLFFLALTVVGVIFFFMVKKGADQGDPSARCPSPT